MKRKFAQPSRLTRLEKFDKIESKNDYKSRIEREKIDELRSMNLHGQFGRDKDEKNQ